MALLSEKERKEYFEYLGLGEYNEANIKALQKKYMSRKSDVDGKYGQNTDNLLRTLYNTKAYTKNFKVEEFKCECNGKYCCGFPDYMKPAELKMIQAIRDHWGKPVTITCGLRCAQYNKSLNGSIQNSLHLTGNALDYYQQGVTDTLANRKAAIKWIKQQPNHHYTYGNGINSYGASVSAKYMGNALHTDTQGSISSQPSGKLNVDGKGGGVTVKRMQEFFGTTQDGVISGQDQKLGKYYPALTAVQYGSGGSACIKQMQKWLGISADGVWGEVTSKVLQRKLGVSADGIFGENSMKAWQKYLNSHDKPDYPVEKPKVIDVSNFQDTIDWAKVKNAGIKGAIVKCGYRGAEKGSLVEDSRFIEHIHGAYNAGLPVGIYMFTQAMNASEGKAEADYAIKMWQKANVPISFPIAVDVENVFYKDDKGKRQPGRANSLSKAKRTEAVKAFCEEIKARGYEPMIYASTSWLNDKLDMSQLPYKVWVAQYYDVCEYKGSYILWQYTSDGSVNGVSGRVDVSYLYTDLKPVDPPKDTKKYTGELPTLRIVKSNAEVIADTVKWAVIIAGNNAFHYGYTNKHGSSDRSKWNPNAHHNGCYFCGTNVDHGGRSKKGILDYQHTYCCNPFVGAAWAHGGCVPAALKLCQSGSSWNFEKGTGYDKSNLFDHLGKIAKSNLKKGDVLCRDNHVMLYIGDGKVAHAHGGDDNVKNSKSWNNSINVEDLGDKKYLRVHRFNSKVDATLNIYFGEISNRVALMQKFFVWYGLLSESDIDGIFFEKTHEAVIRFQQGNGLVADGIVGSATLAKMAEVEK